MKRNKQNRITRRRIVVESTVPFPRRLTSVVSVVSLVNVVAVIALAPDDLSAQAATPPDTLFELEEIVVTATRTPMHVEALPAAVTVITGEELERRGAHHVADALRTVPSLHVVRTGPPGGATSLFLRGGESDHVQILVDGVPINQPGGALDLATLSTDNVARIEV
ncbi:MAG: TonB-dependent receptor, partial [Longimicrobiales bacterium]